VRAVAKRLRRRCAATAKRDGRLSLEIDLISVGVAENERAFYEERACGA
jgi:hypothetical protein